jgi:hypothetical protein
MEPLLLDAAGHRRSPATMPGYHRGRPPTNKGEEYPPETADLTLDNRRYVDLCEKNGMLAV